MQSHGLWRHDQFCHVVLRRHYQCSHVVCGAMIKFVTWSYDVMLNSWSVTSWPLLSRDLVMSCSMHGRWRHAQCVVGDVMTNVVTCSLRHYKCGYVDSVDILLHNVTVSCLWRDQQFWSHGLGPLNTYFKKSMTLLIVFFFRQELWQVWYCGARAGPRGWVLARAHQTRQVGLYTVYTSTPDQTGRTVHCVVCTQAHQTRLVGQYTVYTSTPDQTGTTVQCVHKNTPSDR